MPDLQWYVKRLQAMDHKEVIARGIHAARKVGWRARFEQIKNEIHFPTRCWPLPDQKAMAWSESLAASDDARNIITEADSYLQRKWDFFNCAGVEEPNIDWHRDPHSGKSAPRKFSFDIDHREESRIGNIKNIWEKSRHHHLSILALAYSLTKDEKYGDEVFDQIEGWIEQNPYLEGVNWSHPLEQGIRIISWWTVYHLLPGHARYDKFFAKDAPFWTSLFQHCEFIAKTYSRGSSANNHLIGEVCGLWVASITWPVFEQSIEWRKLSRSILEKEMDAQTFASGLNREMAFAYHIFALEFFLVAYLCGEKQGMGLSTHYQMRLRKQLEVLDQVSNVKGIYPSYGDADEGFAIRLHPRTSERTHWLKEVSQHLFGAAKTKETLAANFVCTHVKPTPTATDTHQADRAKSFAYEDAGLYFLAESRGSKDEILVTADAGPFGFLSIAAHAHADQLHFTLSVAGLEIFVDPGTYCYHGEAEWRQYFRGTSAHNTVALNGEDQAKQLGHFMWGTAPKSFVESWDPKESTLRASHNGYQHLGATHTRTWQLKSTTLQVVDSFEGTRDLSLRQSFHLHPKVSIVSQSDDTFVLQRQNVRVRFIGSEFLTFSVLREAKDGGWYSENFGTKEPTNTIVGTASSIPGSELVTTMECSIDH